MKLEPFEIKMVLSLVRDLTGHEYSGDNNLCIIQNLEQRLADLQVQSLAGYFRKLDLEPKELEKFIALSTIHTTSWFRDYSQLKNLEGWILDELKTGRKTFRIWSAACSTGQELYSIAFILEDLKTKGHDFEYILVGSDIDKVCLRTATAANYPIKQFSELPKQYHDFVSVTELPTGNVFRPVKSIMDRVQFIQAHLLGDLSPLGQFDIVLLRNVLFYFEASNQKKVIRAIERQVTENGLLCLGASDLTDQDHFTLKAKGRGFYLRELQQRHRVLIIDDSAIAQERLRQILTAANFHVETAQSLQEAESKLNMKTYHALTLDVNLGDENGLDWLKSQKQKADCLIHCPVIIVSDLGKDQLDSSYDIIVAEAAAYFEKSQLRINAIDLVSTIEALIQRSFKKSDIKIKHRISTHRSLNHCSLILVGASTGGPKAVAELLDSMPKHCPPVVVVQHLDWQFQEAFLSRLCAKSGLINGHAASKPGDDVFLKPGHIYAALTQEHIGVHRKNGQWVLSQIFAPPVHRCRPSVDVLFSSVTEAHDEVIAVLLTGMGKDGAKGLKSLHSHKSITFVQDEATSVVWGMPGEAYKMEAADFMGSPQEIRSQVLSLIEKPWKKASGI